jgi:hypothetical protein
VLHHDTDTGLKFSGVLVIAIALLSLALFETKKSVRMQEYRTQRARISNTGA